MTAVLADGNVLIALTVRDHIHHRQAAEWFLGLDHQFATCPMTQGTLLRLLVRQGVGAGGALAILQKIVSLPEHVFWPDEIGYDASTLAGVIGHRQVTDAYLAALATHFGGRVATLDKGLAALHPDTAARTPATLLAAMAIPLPLPHTQTPRSASPAATVRPTAAPKSG